MSIKKNTIANYAGQGWNALMAVIFIPLYIEYLGMEAYGLIGFFILIQALMFIFDMGISATINREMARYTSGSKTPNIWIYSCCQNLGSS